MIEATAALRFDQVTLRYGKGIPVAERLDLEVAPGEVVALVGPSGIGKTTLLKAAAGLMAPAAGHVTVFGAPRPGPVPRGTIGYIPQRLGLVHHATALDNVLHGALHRMPAWRALLGVPTREANEAALGALERVGLAAKADTPVRSLSGGQQRRVAVARALVQRPRILLADEFLGELDSKTADIVETEVLRLAERHGTAILLVEHHLQKARRMADRVLMMDHGHVRDITTAARAQPLDDVDLDDDPRLQEADPL